MFIIGTLQFNEMRSKWTKTKFCYLDSHNDKICSLASNNGALVSASKDTTSKVWNKCGQVQHTLGDHASSVTGVFIRSDKIWTSSYDCKLRMWDINSGKLEYSHYLFSPITLVLNFSIEFEFI